MKTCGKCKQEKDIINFCNRKGEKDGKHRYCKSCLNGDFNKYYHSSGRKNSSYYKQYREENKEYFRKYCSDHYHANKDLYREWNKNKYHSDFGFRLKHTVASRIWHALKTYEDLKNDRTIEYLGCSIGEYFTYLENQFDQNMNWENYGEYWEIDHIKPIDSFDFNIEENIYACFHYMNTRPLNKTENKAKSNKIIK
jgi:hypothetical protein